MSRNRAQKAQRRMTPVENTIDFNQAQRQYRPKAIDLIPRTRNQERLVMALQDYRAQDIADMIEEQTIEIAPLGFMRGRTFKNCFIIADEFQNSSAAQVLMLMTRIGEGSKIVITGDTEQADHKRGSNGLVDLCERLQRGGVKGISVCNLDDRDVQRHPMIKDILKLYDE